jgi:hypothetical protein
MSLRTRVNARRFLANALLPVSLLSLLAVSASSGLLTGAYGYFSSSASATMSVAEGGSIALSWLDTASSGSTLRVDVGPLMPSETVQRIADLANTGSVGMRQLQLSVSGTGTGSTSDGVQLAIDRCSVPWVADGSGFTCSETTTTVTPDRPLEATLALSDSPAAARAGRDHLRFSFRLPDSAPDNAQGLSGSVSIVATGSR